MNPYREHRVLLLLQHRLGACEVKHGLERARELAALAEEAAPEARGRESRTGAASSASADQLGFDL